MKTSSGISEIVENIMASYEARVKAISNLSKETADLCRRFRKEREHNDIRGHLAKGEKTRLKEYNAMMGGINKNIDDIRKEVANLTTQAQTMLADFRKERASNDIKGKLAKGEKARHHEYRTMMGGINKDIEDIRKTVAELTGQAQTMLADFRKERASNDIKGKLAQGENARQQDYQAMMGGIHDDINRINKDVADLSGKTQAMMTEFRQENQQMATEWQAMESVISGKGRNPKPRTKIAKKTTAVKERVTAHTVVPKTEHQEKQRTTVHVAPPKTEHQEKEKPETAPTDLPTRILKYMGKHGHNGVKIGEMEEPLGVTRLRLGKAAKELLEQGKLRKEDDRYFLQ